MFNLEKLKDNNAIFWCFKWHEMQRIAAEGGWALGLHGSVVHDLDVMAMPWVKNHITADELVGRLAEAVDSEKRGYVKDETSKPNNRIVYTIYACDSYIDLNVIKEVENEYKPENM